MLLRVLKHNSESVQGRLRTIALCESSREDVISSVALWLSPRNICPVRPELCAELTFNGCTVVCQRAPLQGPGSHAH